ncbi:energy-coupling factor transporter transmembrane component T family protein, partial [Corynebacterium argentoratense]
AFCVLSWVGFLPWVSDVQAQPWLNQQRMVGALLPAVQLSTLVLASVAVLPLVRGPELVDTLIGMLKVPYRFVDIALFGNRFMARIRRDMSFVQHQYRLTTRNARRRIGLLRLVPVVTVASLRDSEQLADALDSRGFGASSTRTLRHYRPLTALDIAAGLGFFAFLLLLPSIAEFFWRLL